MTKHLEKPLPGTGTPAPREKRSPMSGWKILGLAAVFIAAGGIALTPLLGERSGDRVSDSDKAQITAAYSKVTAVQVAAVPQAEVKQALDSMKLTPDARRALQVALDAAPAPAPAPAPGANPASAPQPQGTRLAYVTVWDSQTEDGDQVTLSSAGYELPVRLAKVPQTFAVPVDASATIKVTGLYDGGGGITLGIKSGTGAVMLPVMVPGQVLVLPVAF
jgi:hypothetical protein